MAEYFARGHMRFVNGEWRDDNGNVIEISRVRHGRWVSVPHKLARVCSVCNRDEPYKFADIDADVYDYCPNCGAKMDGGAGNGC